MSLTFIDKYYICDAAYTNTHEVMTPYRKKKRYWLSDYRRPHLSTKEKKFNHAYAHLRNIIKRVYGVLNTIFLILKQMTHHFLVQIDVVITY